MIRKIWLPQLSALALLLVAGAFSPVAAGDGHPFSVHDMLAMERISDPRVSPDGSLVAFTVRATDLEANAGRFNIYVAGLDGREARQLTSNPAADHSARFAPDGRSLYFLSDRGGSTQVWRISLEAAGGEATQVTDLPLDLEHMMVSPDGSKLVVSARVFADCDSLACTAARLAERAAQSASGRIYERLFIRHWDEWKDGRRRQLLALSLAEDVLAGERAVTASEAVLLMSGMDADSPYIPWGSTSDLAFTPDGAGLVFAARDVGREEAWSTNFDLFLVPLDASSPPRNLTADNPAWDKAPVFSPDGTRLAYLAMARPGYESDRLRVVVMDWPSGERRTLTEDWELSPGSIAWAPDGRRLYATAFNRGQVSIFSVDARPGRTAGEVKLLIDQGTNRSVRPHKGGILFTRDTLAGPVELWTADAEGRRERRVTNLNTARMDAVRTGEFEQFTFEGAGGNEVWGYLVKPVDFDPARRYPVAFLIHGGPQGSFGNHFHYRWNPQAYAGAGYAAVMIDFHGSVGYGQEFVDAIRGDWGGAPYRDLKKGLDAALERYPFLDGDRVAALGASYGGYMIFWIAGQTDRFRCLVAHNGIIDTRMAYFDTEELWFPEWEHEGTPWENPEGYSRHNPVLHVQNWTTPTLVVHSAHDYRVALTQGIGAFNALQRLGVPSRFLYFPDENHWVLKPANSILWHETVLDWLDRFTD